MTKDNDSPGDRARVRDKIQPTVFAFLAEQHYGQWHAEDLRRYVQQRHPEIAPGSPDRCLRAMREDGLIEYDCDRSRSLYQQIPLDLFTREFQKWMKFNPLTRQ